MAQILASQDLNDFENSLEYLNKAIEICINSPIQGLSEHINLLNKKITTLKSLNRYKEAVTTFEYKDSLQSLYHTNSKDVAIADMNAKFKVQEEQLKTEKLNYRNQRLTWGIMFTVLGLVFTSIFAWLFYHFYQRKKRHNLELEVANQAKIKLIEELNGKNQVIENKLKNKLLILSSNNKSLDILKKEILALDIENKRKREFLHILDSSINEDIVDNIEQEYLQTNQEFVSKLRELHPDLSDNNVKLCLLIKLGLSYKEISSLNYNSPESIKVAKSRLKKNSIIQKICLSINI